MECYIPGSGGKISVIMTAAVALASLAALVAGCLGQFLRLCVQKIVECLLHAAADQLLDLPLDYFLVELYNVVGHGLLSPFRMCVVTSFYQRPASRVYFFMLFSICAFYYTLSALSYLLPDLLYRIHLWCVWRDMEKYNILRHFQCSRFVPCSSIAAHQNGILRKLFG